PRVLGRASGRVLALSGHARRRARVGGCGSGARRSRRARDARAGDARDADRSGAGVTGVLKSWSLGVLKQELLLQDFRTPGLQDSNDVLDVILSTRSRLASARHVVQERHDAGVERV